MRTVKASLDAPSACARLYVVFNPTAGAQRRSVVEMVSRALAAKGAAVTIAETIAPGHAEELARGAVREGARLVVAAGGDGTIAEVANGIAGSDAALAVIPLGTANVIAHEWGLPFAVEAIAHALAASRTRPMRPLLARFGDGRARLVLQMLGVGLDSAVVASLDGGLKRRLGKSAYVLETVRQVFAWPFPRLAIRVDGEALEVAQAIATKGRFYGGRLLLAPHARAEAEGFVAALFPGRGRLAAIRAGLALPLNLLPSLGGVSFRHARSLGILAPAGLPVQADGDLIGRTPVLVTEAETAIPLVVPA